MAVKFGIQLPEWYERKLRLVAKVRGANRATLSASWIQERLDEDWPEVERDIEAIARYQNKTVEELEKEWLDEED